MFELFSKEKKFLRVLKNQLNKIKEGIGLLIEFLVDMTEDNKNKVLIAEKEADILRKQIVDELNISFITPFDREDINALSRAVDDIMDYIKTTVEEMVILKVKTDNYMIDMVKTISKGMEDLILAFDCISNKLGNCREYLVLAKKTENNVEDLYRKAIAELFETDNIKNILKTREVYRHLSNAADRLDEAANVMSNILVKIS
ncbi:MAG: DUF47 family protein [Endomicrobia bacterium]|nr:DUF47 family protein [Endomicrobiia bacterium]